MRFFDLVLLVAALSATFCHSAYAAPFPLYSNELNEPQNDARVLTSAGTDWKDIMLGDHRKRWNGGCTDETSCPRGLQGGDKEAGIIFGGDRKRWNGDHTGETSSPRRLPDGGEVGGIFSGSAHTRKRAKGGLPEANDWSSMPSGRSETWPHQDKDSLYLDGMEDTRRALDNSHIRPPA